MMTAAIVFWAIFAVFIRGALFLASDMSATRTTWFASLLQTAFALTWPLAPLWWLLFVLYCRMAQ